MRALGFLLLATTAFFAACGDAPPPMVQHAPSSAPSTPAALVSAAPAGAFARAATLAAEQPGYRYTFQLAVRGLPDTSAGAFELSGAGAVDQRANRSSISLDLRSLRDLLAASGDMTAAEFESFLGDGSMELIQDGGTVYVRMPFLARLQGASTPWVSVTVPAAQTAGMGGLGGFVPLSGLGGLGGAGTPADYLEHLRAIDGAITVVGTEQVRGVATTRYRGALDVATLLKSSATTAEERAQLDIAAGFLAGMKLPYDVWIDGDGLPRRLSTTLDFGAFAASFGGPPSATGAAVEAPAMVFSYDLFDYGSPGSIDLPPASQVTAIDPATLEALAGAGF